MAAGGAERVTSILIKEFCKSYNITLFLINNDIFYDIPKNTKIIYFENHISSKNGILKFLKLPFFALKYMFFCKKYDIDISMSFMNQSNYINILSKLFGCKSKVIINERAFPTEVYKTKSIKNVVSKLLIKTLYLKADVIVANSKGNALDLSSNFAIKNVIIINNPVEIQDTGIKQINDKFTFITIGRLDSGKNHSLIINAMVDKDAILYIIGRGELKSQLQNQIKELKLEKKVFLLGEQKNPFIYLLKSDCFIFSSNYEGFPNVLLEALACELPIISTDCKSGPREILAPNTNINFQLKNNIEIAQYGILTSINDYNGLSKAMFKIIKDTKLLASYKKKAIIRANDFDKSKISKKYIEIIEN